ncbi:CoF synthetase [Streptococcus chenjunshii]|uniref:CoF synthetase n=1 Tax=Streptococcus chenjunshii TaxID=2173853 RepID=A0A372KKY8_9STRE|nr:F390 synthetase-related protein [Streptococcus chenjunshii]AXQ79196.1 CoF synthetase [Streptococcus chenjunshii]RFU50768.1 CoF synthetase [Streptococcus chenjunshii]RFU52949.1 CoF synthetase [Streptococcus chenjunshii]
MKKYHFLKSFIKTRWLQHWPSRQALEAYQKKAVAKQLAYFQAKSPYFQKHPDIDSFHMDKDFMMTHFDELNTVGIKKDTAFDLAIKSERLRDFSPDYQGISVGLSSGTSGHRGIFLTSPKEQAVWAGTILAKLLPKKRLLGHKIAFFLRANNNLYETVQSPFIKLHYFDMTVPLENHLKQLDQLQPTILIAPASVLNQLAAYQAQRDLDINPEKIISVAEILEKEDHDYIAAAFDKKIIYQIYQATEGFLGYSCDYGRLHLNEDGIKFEKAYIDDKRFYPIITDFKRQSQPFVSYQLNDILVDSNEECPCGSPLQVIEKIEGRADDIFYFKNSRQKEVLIYPDFIRRCFLFTENIREYQVFQLSEQEVSIAVKDLNQTSKHELQKEFNRLFASLDIRGVRLRFIAYQPPADRKLRRVCRLMAKS